MSDYDSSLSILIEKYPHIKEKAIVDFLNTMPVLDDHLKEKEKCVKSPGARLWSAITGCEAKRQSIIDVNFHSQIKFVQSYILENEERFANSDILMAEAMEGLGLVSEKLKSLSEGVESLIDDVSGFKEKLFRIEHDTSVRLEFNELYMKAQAERNAALAVFKAGEDGLAPEQALWVMLVGLRYGYFGLWLSKAKERGYDFVQPRDNELKALRLNSLEILSTRSNRNNDELITREELFHSLGSGDQPVKDSLCALSTHKSSALENITFQVNSEELGDLNVMGLPYIYSNQSIANEMMLLLDQETKYG